MPEQPNVFVFFTDQQRWDTVGAYGSPMDLTPALDAVADRGTLFERAFTPQPVCGPARSCLQTGQYGTETGVWTNGIRLPDDAPHVAEQFNDAGYRTGYVGKWHLADEEPVPEDRRAGYEDYWRVADLLEYSSHPYEGVVYDEDEEPVEFEGYRVDALTDMAIDFVRESVSAGEPFFCTLSHLEPHHQNDMESYGAPDGYAWQYRNPWVPEDLAGHAGNWYEHLPDYYGICRRLDECFRRVIDELEELGIREDTIVAFISDHGCHFWTRNREYKRSPHESSIRVPFVVDGPGFEDGDVSELVTLLDLPPTLLDAAGLEVPDAMQGESTVPLTSGEADWRDDAFVQLNTRECGRVLRTERWKYVVHDPDRNGGGDISPDEYVERYLYDLRADPHEQRNLIGRADHREAADALKQRLIDRVEQYEGHRPTIRDAAFHA
ncbi:MAG: sulfatase-like hydrolase/transferase [Halobacteriales archaeon]